MSDFTFEQVLDQLEKRKGGYYYFHIDPQTVEQLPRKKATRLLCTVEDQITYSCGLNHTGDGSFFIILAGKHVKKLNLELGQPVKFYIQPDPNPLGVEIPEVLEVFLSQDTAAQKIFDALTDGKKRSLIYSIQRIKNIDKQVQTIVAFIEKEAAKASAKF